MKTVWRNNLISILFLALALALAACGGRSSSGPVPASGKFIDGPIEGLGYDTGSTSGVTGAGGIYTYYPGNEVRFFIGNIDLGTVLAQPVVSPLHLYPGANASSPQVVRMSRFLLSIGTLNPDNSITIPPAVFDAAMRVAPVSLITLTDDAQLEALVKAVKGNAATLVTEAEAISHLTSSLLNEYQGTYQGVFNGIVGDSDRSWVLVISPDGTVTGYGSNKVEVDVNHDGVRELVNESITGTLTNVTDFNATARGGCMLTGNLNPATGVLSGTWAIPNSNPRVSGTFSGRK